MGFHEVQFPTDTNYGTSGGPGHSTAIIELPSGQEERVARWSGARMRFSVKYDVKIRAQTSALRTFVRARHGALHGFRYKDFADFASTADGATTANGFGAAAVSHQDQLIGTGDGTTTTFQLVKTYSSGGFDVVRPITKPVAGTTVIAFGNTQQSSGWSVDTTTGIVTFTVAPTLGVQVKAGFEFDVPVRVGKGVDELLDVSMDSFNSDSVREIELVEEVNPSALPEVYFYGGAFAFGSVTADQTLTFQMRAVTIDPTVAGVKLFLPDTKVAPGGGPFWFIKTGGTDALSLRTPDDTEVVSIPSGSAVVVYLCVDSVGFRTWYTK